MPKKNYIILDVGGTEIKGGILDINGKLVTEVSSYKSLARADKETILNNLSYILEELVKLIPKGGLKGVGFAFPGPFDFENGISLMKGINKYDSIYGLDLEHEMKRRLPELETVSFKFLHDVEAFGVGECYFGKAVNDKKVFCLCIGTGAGSVFLDSKTPLKEAQNGVPENGWVYCVPYKEGIIDDYISVRGLANISSQILGQVKSGKELAELSGCKDVQARMVWEIFGEELKKCITPFLDNFQPDAVVLGGQISKSFSLFGMEFQKECEKRQIKIYVEPETSVRTMQGLFVSMR